MKNINKRLLLLMFVVGQMIWLNSCKQKEESPAETAPAVVMESIVDLTDAQLDRKSVV